MAKKPQNNHPAFIFDLGGVLIDWNPLNLYTPMFEGRDAERDYFMSVVCPQEWNAQQDAGRPFPEAIEVRMQEFPEYAPYIEAYFSRWEEMITGEITGTVKILAALKDMGYPLYALSNWGSETYDMVHEQFEFLSWFQDRVISGKVKMVKPDPEIFEYLLKRIQREAQDCLFIDDTEENIVVAKRLGFETIHFVSPEQLENELCQRGLIKKP